MSKGVHRALMEIQLNFALKIQCGVQKLAVNNGSKVLFFMPGSLTLKDQAYSVKGLQELGPHPNFMPPINLSERTQYSGRYFLSPFLDVNPNRPRPKVSIQNKKDLTFYI